jgi:hypothetical protein
MLRSELGTEWWWPKPRGRGDVLDLVKHLQEEWNLHRKALLALCAICRVTWHQVKLSVNRRALEASEDYADGAISQDQLVAIWRETRFEPVVYCEWACAAAGPAEGLANWGKVGEQDEAALVAFHATFATKDRRVWWSRELDFVMDVLDFAYCGAVLSPEWRTETVIALAAGIYNERGFDRMPILADALHEAGCDNDNILNHCRGDGPHVRGCWVVDLVLGRE